MAKEKLGRFTEQLNQEYDAVNAIKSQVRHQELHMELQNSLIRAMESSLCDYDVKVFENVVRQLVLQTTSERDYSRGVMRRAIATILPSDDAPGAPDERTHLNHDEVKIVIATEAPVAGIVTILEQLGVEVRGSKMADNFKQDTIPDHPAEITIVRSSLKNLVEVYEQMRSGDLSPEQLRAKLEASEEKFEEAHPELFMKDPKAAVTR